MQQTIEQTTANRYRVLAAELALQHQFEEAKRAMWASQLPLSDFQSLAEVSFPAQQPSWMTNWGENPHLPGNGECMKEDADRLYGLAATQKDKPYMVGYYILLGHFGHAIQAMLEWDLAGAVFGQ